MKLIRILSLIFVILLGSNLTTAQSSVKQKDFDASLIVKSILKEVGSFEFNSSNSCPILEKKLEKIYNSISCQKAAHKVSEAQSEVDRIMKEYKIEAVTDWAVTEAGASRIFISKEQFETQSINVFLTNKLVLLGY